VKSKAVVDGIIHQLVKGINQVEMGEVHLHDKMEFFSTEVMLARKPQKPFFSSQRTDSIIYLHG
jgi:hypothetical protein